MSKGRGASLNPKNKFTSIERGHFHQEGLDEQDTHSLKTDVFTDNSRTILNQIQSPDIPLALTLNPYQGCEHGCAYCYARNAHMYWGYSAGLDFEQKIIIKPDASALLKKAFDNPSYTPQPIALSGNTDCYQPIERDYHITRSLLKVMLDYQHPVSIITKNRLILRDIDLISALAKLNLVHVYITITTLDEDLRRTLEPRTSSVQNRLDTIRTLTNNNIPTGVMAAPIIPGLTSHETDAILKAGALSAGYTMLRLNGAVQEVFIAWITEHYPNAAKKVLNQIASTHGGNLNDSRFGTRMHGEGPLADLSAQIFASAKRRYFADKKMPDYNLSIFKRNQLSLF